MSHLEYVDRPRVDRDGLGLGIAREQHREVAPLGDEHQAEQVWVLPGLAEQFARRPNRAQMEGTRGELAALREPGRLSSPGQRRAAQSRIGSAVDDSIDVHRAEQLAEVS